MSQEKMPNLKPLFPDVFFTLNPPSTNLSHLLMVQFEVGNYVFLFEIPKQSPALEIQVMGKVSRSFTLYGSFSSFEVSEILHDLMFKQTSQYFPRSFDDLNLTTLQQNKLQAILSLALCVL